MRPIHLPSIGEETAPVKWDAELLAEWAESVIDLEAKGFKMHDAIVFVAHIQGRSPDELRTFVEGMKR